MSSAPKLLGYLADIEAAFGAQSPLLLAVCPIEVVSSKGCLLVHLAELLPDLAEEESSVGHRHPIAPELYPNGLLAPLVHAARLEAEDRLPFADDLLPLQLQLEIGMVPLLEAHWPCPHPSRNLSAE